MASEDEKVTVYLQKHKIRAILDDMEAKLVKELPSDPIAFIIAKLQVIEKANKKSPSASATTASPKRVASTTTPKAVGKSPGIAKSPASAPAVPKAASFPTTTTTTTITPKGTSRPATAGSKLPTRPKATPSPSGATRPATATPNAVPVPKGGRGPASGGVVNGKASSTATAKAAKPIATTKPKVGGAKVGGAKEEGVAKVMTKAVVHKVTDEEKEEEKEGREEEDEASYAGGGAGEEEEEMGMSGSIAGREGDSSSESDEGDESHTQDEVQVDQLLDAHRRARLPRKSCPKAKVILELRAESPSLGYVSDSDSSEEGEGERSRGGKSTEDEVKLSEEGITTIPAQGLIVPKVTYGLDDIRPLLCERCAALLPNGATLAVADRDSVSPVPEEHDITTDTEVGVQKEAILSVQHDRYGWGR